MSELLTARDVAAILRCSEDAVVKRFAKVQGVLDLGQSETRNRLDGLDGPNLVCSNGHATPVQTVEIRMALCAD